MLSVKFNLTKKGRHCPRQISQTQPLPVFPEAVLSSAQVVARAKGACRLGEKEEAAKL